MKKLLSMLSLSLAFSSVIATPLCPPSNAVGLEGIGDGCSVPAAASALFPHLGAFKDTFTPACNLHDKCYTTLGTSYESCNNQFLDQMKNSCRKYLQGKVDWKWGIPIVRPPDPALYAACTDTAYQYYQGVRAFASQSDPLRGLQQEALQRSRALEARIQADTCQTVPEATTLFSDALLTKVNNAFQVYKGRAPTTLEFLSVVNHGSNIVTSPGAWDAELASTVQNTWPPTSSPRSAVHRYVNQGGAHFYTDAWSELGGGVGGWSYEGTVGYVATRQTAGTLPLLRYFNTGSGDHFYTTNWQEVGAGGNGWVFENIVGFCESNPVPGTQPLYRYYGNGQHFYTQNWSELQGGALGYGYEGVACHVYVSQ